MDQIAMSRKRNESIKMTLAAEKIWPMTREKMNTPAPRAKNCRQ